MSEKVKEKNGRKRDEGAGRGFYMFALMIRCNHECTSNCVNGPLGPDVSGSLIDGRARDHQATFLPSQVSQDGMWLSQTVFEINDLFTLTHLRTSCFVLLPLC